MKLAGASSLRTFIFIVPRGTACTKVELPFIDSVDFSNNAAEDEWANTVELD